MYKIKNILLNISCIGILFCVGYTQCSWKNKVNDLTNKTVDTLVTYKKATAATAVASFLAYRNKAELKDVVQSTADEMKYTVFGYCIIPAIIKWEEYKEFWQELEETPLTFGDTLGAGLSIGMCYALKKIDDKAGFSHACLRYLYNNKKETALSLTGIYLLYKVRQSIQSDNDHTHITLDTFINDLTLEQRKIIQNSASLMTLIGLNNPSWLLNNKEFRSLLNEEQSQTLESLVKYYERSMNLIRAEEN
jgi:hypothetical protein